MITIYGTIKSDETSLIEELKKFFEAEKILLNWDGKPIADQTKTTLTITNQPPPYQAACTVLPIKTAKMLLTA